jgi:hypothetical protein
VCPEVVTAKDTPCKVATPTASIVHRIETSADSKLKQLEEENKMLRKLVEELKNDKSSK